MKYADLTVAILAGGNSSRFGSQKALASFKDRPLISHMLEIAASFSSHILVVISDDELEKGIRQIHPEIEIVSDPEGSTRSALNGAVTAFEFSKTRYTLLLPVDTPMVHKGLLNSLLQLRNDHGAIIPCWPNGFVEPLHGVYLTEHAYSVGYYTLESGKRKMQHFLDSLRNVLYVTTEVLKTFDPELLSFSNINTPADLRDLERKL